MEQFITNSCPGTLTGVPSHLFLGLINALFAAQCSLKPPLMTDYAPNLKNGDEFDFIVVGAGSAGSVVANRLSEVGDWKVLVLEAGGDPSVATEIPSMLFSIQGTSEDWQQKTEPQEGICLGFKDKRCRWASGRVLGGSSSINGMLYIRGNRRDYDNWEKLGNPGWSFNDILPYFKKSEDNQEFGDNSDYHGKGGYLKVSPFSYNYPAKKIISKGVRELGYPVLKDLHNGTDIGFGDGQGTVFEGKRYSTYKAFLYSVKDRPNLYVAKNALVGKVLVDSSTKTVNGVEVKIGGEVLHIKAKKEIILSAGALRTPQILMLSGIGPEDHLKEMNIPVIKSLPVGQNLQDHMIYFGTMIAIRDQNRKWAERDDKSDLKEIYDYFMNQKGLLSKFGITNFVGFVDTLKNSEFPDIQYHHIYYKKDDSVLLNMVLDATGVNEEIKENIRNINQESPLLQMCPTLLNPKSTGYIKLRSTNPADRPLVYSNYLKEDEDLETFLRSIRLIQKLIKTAPFSKHKAEIMDLKLSNCAQHTFLSDDYLRCAVRTLASTLYHYSSTAKMGPETDPTAVVDSRLKVHGIKGLRVADASIMPNVVSGNTNAPCIMIGEKISDMIKEDWNHKNNVKEEL